MNRKFMLKGLELQASIGIYDHERAAPQRVVIDAELMLDGEREPQNDDVAATLDYDQIRDTIRAIVTSRHFDLQETLARTLFDALAALPDVTALCVTTAKPDAYDDCETIAYQLSNLPGQLSNPPGN